MPFQRIDGTFHVVGYQPDGDTIRFSPTDPQMLAGLSGPPARVNARGRVPLRLEGIDTLETHFEGLQQPAPFAHGAVDRLLDYLGITNVVWSAGRGSVSAAADGVPGHILSRATDKFGRVIAFAFPGAAADEPDHFLAPDGLTGSANLTLVAEGLAFATFYSSLFQDLRDVLAAAVRQAQAARLGLHAVDRTATGASITGLASLTDDHVLLPKLFRRAAVYVRETGGIAGFKVAMEASQEPVLDLTTMNFTHFDTFIEEAGQTIRLSRDPLDLVFDPMPQRIGTDFRALVDVALPPDRPTALAPAAPAVAVGMAPVSPGPLPSVAAVEIEAFRRRVRDLKRQLL